MSAVLFRLEKYEECLIAIGSYLGLNNYPEHLKLDIFFNYLCKLNRKSKAEKAHKKTEDWIKEKIPAEDQLEKLNQLKDSFETKPVLKKIVTNIFNKMVK